LLLVRILGEWPLQFFSSGRNGHAAVIGALKFEAKLPPLNFGAKWQPVVTRCSRPQSAGQSNRPISIGDTPYATTGYPDNGEQIDVYTCPYSLKERHSENLSIVDFNSRLGATNGCMKTRI
jgi:hypothetical protein